MIVYHVPLPKRSKTRGEMIEQAPPQRPFVHLQVSREIANALEVNQSAKIILEGKITGINIKEGQLYNFDSPKDQAEITIEPLRISTDSIKKGSIKPVLPFKLAQKLNK